jgi:hypothetical protein
MSQELCFSETSGNAFQHQGATPQKVVVFKLAAVKTSNLTLNFLHVNTNSKQSIHIPSPIMVNYIHAQSSSDHCEKLNDLSHALLEMVIPYHVCNDGSSYHSIDWTIYYTHHRKMGDHLYVSLDADSQHSSYWMTYFTHHLKTNAPQCVCVDASSNENSDWMTYYTHHI